MGCHTAYTYNFPRSYGLLMSVYHRCKLHISLISVIIKDIISLIFIHVFMLLHLIYTYIWYNIYACILMPSGAWVDLTTGMFVYLCDHFVKYIYISICHMWVNLVGLQPLEAYSLSFHLVGLQPLEAYSLWFNLVGLQPSEAYSLWFYLVGLQPLEAYSIDLIWSNLFVWPCNTDMLSLPYVKISPFIHNFFNNTLKFSSPSFQFKFSFIHKHL